MRNERDMHLEDLPIHPRTGARAVGLRRSGQPIWPISGADGAGDGGAPAAGQGSPPSGGAPSSGAPSGQPAAPSAAGGAGADQGAQGQPPASGKTDNGPAGGVDALRADLAGERDKRQAVERELAEERQRREALENQTKTDSEKALDTARKEGRAESDAQWASRVIRSEAKSALAAANDVTVAVPAFLESNPDLKVNNNGEVEGLAAKVEAFTKAHPTLFTARVPSGNGDGGAAPPPPGQRAGSLEEAVSRSYAAQQQKH